MTKVTVLIPFRGADFSESYEKGKEYNLESARAESLASRGLVRIIKEESKAKESNAQTIFNEEDKVNDSNITVTSHRKKKGRNE